METADVNVAVAKVMSPGSTPRLGWGRVAAAALGLSVASLLVWQAVDWYAGSLLAEATRDVEARRFGEARRQLTRISSWFPGWAEAEYQLGVSEMALGRVDAAVAAWSRVPHGSALADDAALRRADAESDRGHLIDAEVVLRGALDRPGSGPRVTDLRHALLQLCWQEGRLDEVRALIEKNWNEHCKSQGPASPRALSNLKAHRSLDLEVFPVRRVRGLLDRCLKLAPDDSRVWLGLAALAVRTGDLDQGRAWIERCLKRTPADPVVLALALDIAEAVDDPALAARSGSALPAAYLSPSRVDRSLARAASRRGDAAAERSAWQSLLDREPADAQALERLAELEIQAGAVEAGAALRRRKTEVDRTLRLYANNLGGDDQAEAATRASQAETLGRWFEARAYLALLVESHPGDSAVRDRYARAGLALARLTAPSTSGPRLADVFAAPAPSTAPHSDGPTNGLAFQDEADPSGLKFAFENGRTLLRQLPETMSGGVGLIDIDGDGFLDVYCVQGGPFPPTETSAPPGDRLFRNQRDGTFEDVTRASGVSEFPKGYGHGVAVGDVNGDGRADLFVTRWRSYALYLNGGDGRFEDATARYGLGGDRDWPTSAALADLDGDGDLDLYVCHYITWDADHPRLCGTEGGGPAAYCAPHLLPHAADHLFRNDGGKFTDVSTEAGIVDPDGRGLGVVAADLDDDGKVDLFVANDGTANFLFRNLGGLKFEETGLTAGVAANAEGGYQAGMGVACGDLDGDGRPDLVVTNFYGESSSYFRAIGPGLFADRSSQVGLREATRYLLGFGTTLFDADNDGYLDLATANGHVNDVRPVIPYAMPAQLLLGGPKGRLRDVSTAGRAGPAWNVARVGRGLACGDLDNDGRLDLVVVDQDGPLALFRNKGGTDRHFLTLRLEGAASNRDAVGARVTVSAGGRARVAQRTGGGSYQSANDPRLHFGLGSAAKVDSVEIRWPSGRVETARDLAADTGYLIREGDAGRPRRLPGFTSKGPG